MTTNAQHHLRAFERKILPQMLGSERDSSGAFVQRGSNEDLELCEGNDIVKHIRA